MKNIVIHYHIFKNAGSTLEWILHKNFGEFARTLDSTDPEGTLPTTALLSYLEKNPETRSVSSHQLRLPLPKHDTYQFIPMLFIRHPLDRAFSVYSYFRRRNDDYVFSVKARTLDIKQFFNWYFETDNPVIRNFQTVYLTKQDFFDKVNRSDYYSAIDMMKTIPILGVVEKMDESIVIAEEILSKYYGMMDCSFIKQNVSLDRIGSLEERIHSGMKHIGDVLTDRLEKSNELDLLLHNEANRILNDNINAIDNFEEKLSKFRDRCKNAHS